MRKKKDRLTRAQIAVRQRAASIRRLEQQLVTIQEQADEQKARVQRRLAVARVLLKAAEAGEI